MSSWLARMALGDSHQPEKLTRHERDVWTQLRKEVADIYNAGGSVILPFD